MLVFKELIIKNIFLNHISSRLILLFSNQITNIFIFSYLIFIFGIDKFGQFSIALIYTQISIIIIEWGYQTHATENLKKTNNFLFLYLIETTIIKIIFIIFFIVFIFYLINIGLINISTHHYLPISLIIFFGAINPLWYLNLYKKTFILLIPNFIGKIIYISIVLLYLKPETDYKYIYYLISLNFFLNSVFGYWYIFKKNKCKIDLSKFKINKILLNSSSYFLASIINHNITSLWSLYVSLVCSNSSIGIFVFTEQIYRGMCLISNLISNSLRIELINKNFSFFRKYFLLIFIITLLFSIFFITFIFFLIKILYSDLTYVYVGTLFSMSWILFSISKLLSIPILGTVIEMKKINSYILNYGLFNLFLIILSFLFQISNISYIVLFITLASLSECIYYLRKIYLSKLNDL